MSDDVLRVITPAEAEEQATVIVDAVAAAHLGLSEFETDLRARLSGLTPESRQLLLQMIARWLAAAVLARGAMTADQKSSIVDAVAAATGFQAVLTASETKGAPEW